MYVHLSPTYIPLYQSTDIYNVNTFCHYIRIKLKRENACASFSFYLHNAIAFISAEEALQLFPFHNLPIFVHSIYTIEHFSSLLRFQSKHTISHFELEINGNCPQLQVNHSGLVQTVVLIPAEWVATSIISRLENIRLYTIW